MTTKEIDYEFARKFEWPFNTYCRDEIDHLHEMYDNFYSEKDNEIENELDEKLQKFEDELFDDEEWNGYLKSGENEKAEERYNFINEIYETKCKDAQKEYDERINQFDEEIKLFLDELFGKAIVGFMEIEGYKDIGNDDIMFLKEEWNKEFYSAF